MSIIGPRPLMARYLDYYTEEERKRHNVKFKYIIRYIKYIIHRLITHESYGFNGL